MFKTIVLKFNNIQPAHITMALLVVCVATFFVVSPFYIVDYNLYVGILLAPYILTVNKSRLSSRLAIPVMLLVILAFFIPVKTVFGLALIGVVLLMIENSLGRIDNPFIFLMLIISPLYKYWSGFIEFPIRLQLTARSAALINSIGIKASAAGNMITLGKTEFSVDPACAGLNMLEVSFLLTLFIIAHHQRGSGKRLHWLRTASLLVCTFFLNIASNLLRILILVLFCILPQNPMHELTGILCMAVYVIAPMLWLTAKIIKTQKPILNSLKTMAAPRNINGVNGVLVGLMIIAGGMVCETPFNRLPYKNYVIAGYKRDILPTGVIKFENKEALIYFKPTEFYSMGHDPSVCWRGSGYQFKQIAQKTIKGVEIYMGTINKGKDVIYTAWWFDNGHYRTINQFAWRWKALKGNNDFSLVNVNAATKADLLATTEKVLGLSLSAL